MAVGLVQDIEREVNERGAVQAGSAWEVLAAAGCRMRFVSVGNWR